MKRMTEKWWKECLNNKEKLEHWLIGLYNNEKDAEERFINFANTYCQNDKESFDVFMIIADQEKKHAELVDKILIDRGIEKYEKSTKNGRYWRNTLPCIIDMKTAAAIGRIAYSFDVKPITSIIAQNILEKINKQLKEQLPSDDKWFKYGF